MVLTTTPSPTVGFNVIGHLSASSGLGNTARLFIQSMQRNGIPVAGYDIDYNGHAEPSIPIDECPIHKSIAELPYHHNLVIASVQLLPSLWRGRCKDLLLPRFRNAGVIFWELPRIPDAWLPSLGLFDAIVVCSPYVRHAVELAVPGMPTVFAEHPLMTPQTTVAPNATRASLQIDTSAFVVAASFDLRSDITRKNPMAAYTAFRAAFPTQRDVRLLVKTNGKGHSVASRAASQLQEQLAKDPRVVLVEQTMSYNSVQALYACANVFLSLHRAEGLGLGPMEAMLLGKLAIATGYSGNMAYMNEANSLPVRYTLVEPSKCGWQFTPRFAGRNAHWAQADTKHAAQLLQWAYLHPESAAAVAQVGQRDIQNKQALAWSARFVEPLMTYLNASDRVGQRGRLFNIVRANELLDPTLRRLNLKALMQTLAN